MIFSSLPAPNRHTHAHTLPQTLTHAYKQIYTQKDVLHVHQTKTAAEAGSKTSKQSARTHTQTHTSSVSLELTLTGRSFVHHSPADKSTNKREREREIKALPPGHRNPITGLQI